MIQFVTVTKKADCKGLREVFMGYQNVYKVIDINKALSFTLAPRL